jgi:hypothetical protein
MSTVERSTLCATGRTCVTFSRRRPPRRKWAKPTLLLGRVFVNVISEFRRITPSLQPSAEPARFDTRRGLARSIGVEGLQRYVTSRSALTCDKVSRHLQKVSTISQGRVTWGFDKQVNRDHAKC